MKTLIGVPCADMIHTRFVSSLMGMRRTGETHLDFKMGSLVYDSRNQIVMEAIREGADRILMIDSDMRFDEDLMERFDSVYDPPEVEMVSALCFRRRLPTEPVIYRNIDPPAVDERGVPTMQIVPMSEYPRDLVFRVDGCGFGCVMLSTDLAKRVWDRFGPPFAPYPWAGEDISFCYRVKQLGVPVWCDSRIKVGHLGQIEINEELYRKGR